MTTLTLQDEKLLVEESQANTEAFGKIYEHYYPQILRFVSRRTFDYDIACDITSLTFHKALENIGIFKWRGVPFSSWLYRVASNEIKKYYRSQNKKYVALEQVEHFLADKECADTEIKMAQEELENNKERARLHKALSQLKENYHQILILRHWEEKSIKEIAVILGKTETMTKVTLHRATKKLRALMTY